MEEKLVDVGHVGSDCDTIRHQIDLIQVSKIDNLIQFNLTMNSWTNS